MAANPGIKLTKDSIVEALFELRFSTNPGFPADLLPGIVYSLVKTEFPHSESFPINELPAQLREINQNLRHSATQRFSNDYFSIMVGPRVFTISCIKPYPHWEKFRAVILDLVQRLSSLNFIHTVERFALRYINILSNEKSIANQYSQINFKCELGGYDLSRHQTNIRTEMDNEPFKSSISLSNNVTGEFNGGEKIQGMLIDIDIQYSRPNVGIWPELEKLIDEAHKLETDYFFSILTDQTVEVMK